jgi:hypothetical protein
MYHLPCYYDALNLSRCQGEHGNLVRLLVARAGEERKGSSLKLRRFAILLQLKYRYRLWSACKIVC